MDTKMKRIQLFNLEGKITHYKQLRQIIHKACQHANFSDYTLDIVENDGRATLFIVVSKDISLAEELFLRTISLGFVSGVAYVRALMDKEPNSEI